MASTNKTTKLGLSQYEAGDKPSWLHDYNNDMKAIDNGLAAIDNSAAYPSRIEKYSGDLMLITAGPDSNRGLYLGDLLNSWSLSPTSDAGLNLGRASLRWSSIYTSGGVITTSDRTQKKNIESLDDVFVVNMVEKLHPVQYKMKDDESGRTHVGFIAQEVEELLEKAGKTSMDFAGLIKSPKTEEYTEIDAEGKEIKKTRVVENEFIYGLRYEEFIALICRYTQIKAAQQDTLAKEVAELKAIVAELVKK